MPDAPPPTQSEADEARDSDELQEQAVRTIAESIASSIAGALSGGVPIGSDGRPMALVVGGCSDKVPTVQFGNVVLGPAMMYRFVDDGGDGPEGRQHRIDQLRLAQRDTEFAIGVERRLLTWALDPASKIKSPISGQDAFAAPPEGYENIHAVDPRVAIEAAEAEAAAAKAALAEAQNTAPPAAPAPPAGPQVG